MSKLLITTTQEATSVSYSTVGCLLKEGNKNLIFSRDTVVSIYDVEGSDVTFVKDFTIYGEIIFLKCIHPKSIFIFNSDCTLDLLLIAIKPLEFSILKYKISKN